MIRAATCFAVLFLVGCGGVDKPADQRTRSADPPQTEVTSTPASKTLVAIGDSIALAGETCDGCTGFAELWTKGLEQPVEVINDARAGAEASDLLELVRSDETVRGHLERASYIAVSIGINDLPWNRLDDPCNVAADYPVVEWGAISDACVGRAAAQYERRVDAVLDEIDELRGGRPAVVRVVGAYNAVIGNEVDKSWDSPAAVEPSQVAGGLFAANACRVAAAHDAKCIDTLRAFNGPQGDEPAGELLASDYTHPSAKGMALIARLLSETSSR